MFIKNAWYVAAQSGEISFRADGGSVAARRIIERLVRQETTPLEA